MFAAVTFISSCASALGDKDLWLTRNIHFRSFSLGALDNLELVSLSSLIIFSATLEEKKTSVTDQNYFL